MLSPTKYIPPPIFALLFIIIVFFIKNSLEFNSIYNPPPFSSATLLIILHDLIFIGILETLIATPSPPILDIKFEFYIITLDLSFNFD